MRQQDIRRMRRRHHVGFSLEDIIGACSILGVFGSFIAMFFIFGSMETNSMSMSDGIKYGVIAIIVLAISVFCINAIEKEDLSKYDRL
ncbi:MAG: hypothetical protein K6G24_07200 [Lachnospiraceae bacterium]|nr:hypothetical protein [Lachnospiraceae bacterium]